jgi:heptosyltransferase-1
VRILITKLSSFGDVIAACPAVSDAVAAGAEVDWLVDASLAHVAALHPGVRKIHSLEGRSSRSLTRIPAYLAHRGALQRALREGGYDLVVDLQGLLKSALPSRWAQAPVHGYDASSIREPVASALYDVRHTVSWSLHAVERNRALMAGALGHPPPTAHARFGLSAPSNSEGAPYGVILHSASWPSKLWPEERWRALLAARNDLPFRIPWGDEAERERAARLADGLAHVSVLPDRLTHLDLAGFLAGARLVVGLDTGLMHMAHALGAPTVWLFGSTSAEKTGPYGEGAVVLTSTVPAAPCMRRECRHEGGDCMSGVAVSAVLEAVDGVLAR